jgi:hypothetical protein
MVPGAYMMVFSRNIGKARTPSVNPRRSVYTDGLSEIRATVSGMFHS